MDKSNIKTKLKVIFHHSHLGPGIIEIMKLVREGNSLSQAYRTMGLSSSKGWKIIKNAEESLGFPIFLSRVGGVGGGHTSLTPQGEDLLVRYQAFMDELNMEAEKLYEKHFGA